MQLFSPCLLPDKLKSSVSTPPVLDARLPSIASCHFAHLSNAKDVPGLAGTQPPEPHAHAVEGSTQKASDTCRHAHSKAIKHIRPYVVNECPAKPPCTGGVMNVDLGCAVTLCRATQQKLSSLPALMRMNGSCVSQSLLS